jgi:hypothetical protein
VAGTGAEVRLVPLRKPLEQVNVLETVDHLEGLVQDVSKGNRLPAPSSQTLSAYILPLGCEIKFHIGRKPQISHTGNTVNLHTCLRPFDQSTQLEILSHLDSHFHRSKKKKTITPSRVDIVGKLVFFVLVPYREFVSPVMTFILIVLWCKASYVQSFHYFNVLSWLSQMVCAVFGSYTIAGVGAVVRR